MTWRSAICFSLLLAGTALAATVRGRVDLTRAGGQAEADQSGAVVWLEPAGPAAPLWKAADARAEMVQRRKRFLPHVLPVQAGTQVSFPNLDPIFHNAFSNFDGQIFDIGLYPPGTTRLVRFTRPGVVRIFCNIHPTMSAVIVVVNTPYFATTAADGTYQINNLPPGDYYLHVFHERAPQPSLERLRRTVTVGDGPQPAALPPLPITLVEYLPRQHKDKHGHDYPRVDRDKGGYLVSGQ